MPEGPELHLASLYVNKMCDGVMFTGPVSKSDVSKSPDVPFTCEAYRITAASRGKEVKLTLTPMKSDDLKQRVESGDAVQPMDVVFRFGMSGYFRFTPEDALPKHAHLRFYSKEKPCRVLSFVDARRFGSWQPDGTWQPDRGPCIMFEYKSFRENVMSHLTDRAFDRPICEVLLNQKYFNGIGNYLRAEILFREMHTARIQKLCRQDFCEVVMSQLYNHDPPAIQISQSEERSNIPPFVPARTALEGLDSENPCNNEKPVKNEITDTKTKQKKETTDLLRLCHSVPLEVVNLGGKGYDPEKADSSDFNAWLQCYYVDGMKSIRDHNGRTMWFKGDPGPMAPKAAKSPKAKKRVKKEDDHDYTDKKKVARSYSVSKKKVVKQEAVTKTTKKEKDACLKEAGSNKRKTEINTPQHEKRPIARRRKSSSEQAIDSGPKRRSGRATRQSAK